MKERTKAVVISALVFPGAGHLVLGAFKRGTLFILLTLVCVILLMRVIIPVAIGIVADVANPGATPDVFTVNTLLRERLQDEGGRQFTAPLIALIVVWLVAALDVMQLGRQQERSEPPQS